MYWIDIWNAHILEQCPYKTRSKKIEWLLQLFHTQSQDDDVPIYEPMDIIAILNWLKLTEITQNEAMTLLN